MLDPRDPVNSRTLQSTIAAANTEVLKWPGAGAYTVRDKCSCAIKDLATRDCFLCVQLLQTDREYRADSLTNILLIIVVIVVCVVVIV